MVYINNLSFLYGDGEDEAARKSEPGISEINLHIRSGECILLCGASGCGKTTLIKTVNGLLPHFEEGRLGGQVYVNGHEVAGTPMYELAHSVSSVFQNPKSQFFNTDAESEITFALENQGVPVEEINLRLAAVVSALGIEKLLQKSLFAMSGGEKQIVAFAGAYISGANVVVLDEPSANLDEAATQKIREIIKKIKAEGKTLLIAEHRISYLRGLVDRVCYIHNGKILEQYHAAEFYAMSEQRRIGLGLRQLKQAQETPVSAARPAAPSSSDMLEVRNLSLSYGKCLVAEHISFTLYAGDIVGVVGRNGAGKSTLTRFLCGLHEQKHGEVLLNGRALNKKERRKLCGIVMQDVNYQLFSDSVFGECLLGNSRVSAQRVKEILTELGLYELRDVHPQSLSGGQKQRLAVAVAMASDKRVLILDEPTSGLDYSNMITICSLLQQLSKRGVLCIIVTHDTEFLQIACNRCLRLDATGVVEIDSINPEVQL